ncbi:MAG: hypothetical protein GFH27_549309n168 [Chloroflexi bacterium AL-W]|nr:hypothetical protein [Chloroflexi bacterium AL-N1]NOK68186.1 hypothetical protein [Chloroflexi bacterium AL-N10]NOK73526.1 hypothetical protein [Chloroflexi bacterium AL-N5]NOK84040.1 hypothetical protein [Chloroflexi bacterium AL-W]NOK87857.1 hypothetical protein [Chloroflexi bacterium AL-N15]
MTLEQQHQLDQLIVVDGGRHSWLHTLKEPPRRASPQAILRLLDHLEQIEATGILTIDLSWLNNNYQRALTRYATRCSANRLRNLQASHRYVTLTCFLWQTYQDTIDYILDMHTKLVTSVYHHAEKQLDAATRQQRRALRHSLQTLRTISQVLLDPDVADTDLRSTVFTQVSRPALAAQLAQLDDWLTGPQSHVFHLVAKRFPYFRQFAPRLVQALHFHSEHGEDGGDALLQALQVLRDLNAAHKRTLPTDVPLTFLSASMQDFLTAAGTVPKAAWECAVLTAVRDELKSGNIHVRHSKRFDRFDDFFMPLEEWEQQREAFFHRAGLPAHAEAVPAYLRQRLHHAYDQFLDQLPANTYTQIREDRWVLTTDPSIPHDSTVQARLDALRQWLATHMRTMKLPDLLIQVDNEVHFTHVFLPPAQQDCRQTNEICLILAAIMAYGCSIGP